jgi:hypothetical protein
MALKFYLADENDTARVRTDGNIEAAHTCSPMYFDTPDQAYQYSESHPHGPFLHVHSCPAAETVPGLPAGAIYAGDLIDLLSKAPDELWADYVHSVVGLT